ncbi:RNA polymerase II subunit Rpb8 [Spironucleus salmonicida]|uniref:DNA-directed RNA polymerases I, II, and III subunit RPABC3 n=1 Tax=Spironucleus salmonicida TaxID=348837 RepID=V6LVZ4_9EUKA|nr:RNA polymerase II subunit Rpb8 [Spironucleus salmonicida]|eukprot:EST44989.1 RNA polymerase II subunit Rpb8 [Spironucleus salmonicida]
MEKTLFTAKFTVKNVIDCSKEYDCITRVEMESSTSTAILDVHDKLFPQICNIDASTNLSVCCELRVDDTKTLKASDKAYGGEFLIQKAIPDVNYAMCGTVFEFVQLKDNNVNLSISFGGLLLVLTCDVEQVSKFKYGQKVYLICRDTR